MQGNPEEGRVESGVRAGRWYALLLLLPMILTLVLVPAPGSGGDLQGVAEEPVPYDQGYGPGGGEEGSVGEDPVPGPEGGYGEEVPAGPGGTYDSPEYRGPDYDPPADETFPPEAGGEGYPSEEPPYPVPDQAPAGGEPGYGEGESDKRS